MKVNAAGVMPVIFASTLLILPYFFFSVIDSVSGGEVAWARSLANLFQNHRSWVYNIMYIAMIYVFTYFWVAITFNPKEIADNLKDHGSFIPGYRPGKRTADYLERVLMRITYVGAAFLAVIAIIPNVISSEMEIPTTVASFYGGTGLLIVISVALDLVQKINSHLVMRNYPRPDRRVESKREPRNAHGLLSVGYSVPAALAVTRDASGEYGSCEFGPVSHRAALEAGGRLMRLVLVGPPGSGKGHAGRAARPAPRAALHRHRRHPPRGDPRAAPRWASASSRSWSEGCSSRTRTSTRSWPSCSAATNRPEQLRHRRLPADLLAGHRLRRPARPAVPRPRRGHQPDDPGRRGGAADQRPAVLLEPRLRRLLQPLLPAVEGPAEVRQVRLAAHPPRRRQGRDRPPAARRVPQEHRRPDRPLPQARTCSARSPRPTRSRRSTRTSSRRSSGRLHESAKGGQR